MRYDLTPEEFTTLFSYCWYRDFPLDGWHRDSASTANWTIHSGIVTKRVADLLGLFTVFESGGRCDAVLRDRNDEVIVLAEWEWQSPAEAEINEISKLRDKSAEVNPVFSFLLTYTPDDNIEKVLVKAQKEWGVKDRKLLLGLVTYSGKSTRRFNKLKIYLLDNDKLTLLKEKPALPWELEGSRWEDYDD